MKPPKTITDVGLNLYVDTIKLSKLPLEVKEIGIEHLLWHLKIPVWAKDGTEEWNLTPNDVLNKIEGSEGHYQRMRAADITFPILVRKFNKRLVIIDGVHRLLKLFIEGNKKVKVKIIPEDILDKEEYKT